MRTSWLQRLLWIFILLISLISAHCGSSNTGAAIGPPQIDPGIPRVMSPEPEDQTCSMDTDCVLVQDCCGCEAGGRLLAVRQDHVEDLQAAADHGCSDQCARGTATAHRSCSATEAICRGGRCIPSIAQ